MKINGTPAEADSAHNERMERLVGRLATFKLESCASAQEYLASRSPPTIASPVSELAAEIEA